MHQGKEALAVYMKKVKSKYLDMATALLRRQRPSIRLPSFFLAMACKRASTGRYSPTGKILFVFNFYYIVCLFYFITQGILVVKYGW